MPGKYLALDLEIAKEIPSAAPIIEGRLYKIGQIGTFVKFTIGSLTLYGLVSSVSNSPLNTELSSYEPDYGSRFLQVQLIGEKLGNEKFQKGVGTYPTINDQVHIVTEEDLKLKEFVKKREREMKTEFIKNVYGLKEEDLK